MQLYSNLRNLRTLCRDLLLSRNLSPPSCAFATYPALLKMPPNVTPTSSPIKSAAAAPSTSTPGKGVELLEKEQEPNLEEGVNDNENDMEFGSPSRQSSRLFYPPGYSPSNSTNLESSAFSPSWKKLKPYLSISVDGNISSGKSTLVSTLTSLFPREFPEFEVETVPEPLQKWTNVGGHNLLEMLYQDTTKNNFLFQHYVQLTRLADTLTPGAGKVRVMERSIQNNRYCFAELARRQGTLHEAEFSVIAEWYKWLEDHTDLPLDLIVYLRTTPEVVYERMKSRGRSEESTVPLDYLTQLHETYEDWLIRGKIEEIDSAVPKKYEVLVIDANKGKEEVVAQCEELVREFLQRKFAEKAKAEAEESNQEDPDGVQGEGDSTTVSEDKENDGVSPAKKPKLEEGQKKPSPVKRLNFGEDMKE